MAVQAQYPSNVLLFNRNVQEGTDYSFPTQPTGLIEQSHMFFNNGVAGSSIQRKRGRESLAASSPVPINLFSLQPPPPPQPTPQQQSPPPPPPTATTLINLSQLHNQHHNVVSTGLHLSFEQEQQQQQQQSLILPSSSSCSVPSLLSDDLAAQMNHQRDEIDQFLQAQGDQLRRSLAERRQRHYRALLCAAEESAARRLKEKETEVQRATRRNSELEERMAQLRIEAQVWQAKARTQEAHVATLQAQLQQAMMNGTAAAGAQDNNKGDDGLGCAGEAEDAESAYIDPDRVVIMTHPSGSGIGGGGGGGGPVCKACRRRVASVVLLPCRHLCLCTNCDAAVEACPLCLSYRSASVEVFLS